MYKDFFAAMIVLVVILAAVAVCPILALAQAEYSTIVKIDIIGEEEAKERAYDVVLEELSLLKDVKIRGRGQIFGFKLMISSIRPPKFKDQIWGYAATLIVERYPGIGFVDRVEAVLGKSELGSAYQPLARQVLEKGVVHYASLKVVPRDALEDLCREMVALFNAEVLTPDRKRFAEVVALEEELQKQHEQEEKARMAAEQEAERLRKLQEAEEAAEAKKTTPKAHREKLAQSEHEKDESSGHADGHSDEEPHGQITTESTGGENPSEEQAAPH